MDKLILMEGVKKLAINAGYPTEGRKFEQRVSLLYDELGGISNEVFRIACQRLLKSEPRFPAIAAFETAIKDVSVSMSYRSGGAPTVKCEKCNGSGYITALKIKDNSYLGEYSFRCSCENGAEKARGISLWDEEARAKGYIPKEEVDGLSAWDKEGGEFISPREEQRVRLNIISAIRHLWSAGLTGEAQDKLVDLDKRIDERREAYERGKRAPVAQAA